MTKGDTSKTTYSLQPLSLAVAVTLATIILCYSLSPELLSPRIAFSRLGAFPPTSLIFSVGFVVAAGFLLVDMVMTVGWFQKACRFLASVGFTMLGVFRIEHGALLGNLHRLGGLIMLVAVVASMIGHLISGWHALGQRNKLAYSVFVLMALISFVMSLLSSAQFAVIALQGLAQYIGLFCLVGWAIMDARTS